MSTDGDEVPPEYIVKECSFAPVDMSSSSHTFPIIDISLFSPSSLVSSKRESDSALDVLRSALMSSGCFQAIGHGMSSSFLDKVREIGHQFFSLPAEEKQRYARSENGRQGYGRDLIVSEKQVLDWSYRLSLRVFPEDKRTIKFWPENPNNFGEILHEYAVKVKSVMDLLYKAMARSLNLEENSFLDQFGNQSLMQARFNFYPPCSRPELVLGVKPHTDRSGITALLQGRDVEGLQVFVNDRWARVPVIPDALFINLGDQMQIMSNGIFKSAMHRVVTNSGRLRISVAFIHEPEPEKEIGPVDHLVDEKRPRLYRNVKNYGAINYECYQKGMVAIDTVKI